MAEPRRSGSTGGTRGGVVSGMMSSMLKLLAGGRVASPPGIDFNPCLRGLPRTGQAHERKSRRQRQGPRLRRLRHGGGLARQHHPRARGNGPRQGARRRLAELCRRLARRLPAGDAARPLGRAALDPHRRPPSHDPRRAAERAGHLRPQRGRDRPSQPRLAPARPVAGCGGGPWPPQAPLHHRHAVQRQHGAAGRSGKAWRPALGRRALGRARPSLQARSRSLSPAPRSPRPLTRRGDAGGGPSERSRRGGARRAQDRLRAAAAGMGQGQEAARRLPATASTRSRATSTSWPSASGPERGWRRAGEGARSFPA